MDRHREERWTDGWTDEQTYRGHSKIEMDGKTDRKYSRTDGLKD
jgi:hypothetical protein